MRVRREQALGGGDDRRVQLGDTLPDLANGTVHRLLHEVAIVGRLALGAGEIAVEQCCGGVLVLSGHLWYQDEAGPLDELLHPLAPDERWSQTKGVRTHRFVQYWLQRSYESRSATHCSICTRVTRVGSATMLARMRASWMPEAQNASARSWLRPISRAMARTVFIGTPRMQVPWMPKRANHTDQGLQRGKQIRGRWRRRGCSGRSWLSRRRWLVRRPIERCACYPKHPAHATQRCSRHLLRSSSRI